MTCSAAQTLPGWYGKVPSLGDFASRRLPDGFVNIWDEWLERSLARLQQSRGNARCEFAVHRFWIGPRLLSAASWAGVIAPSFDRVGRRFPLTIAAPLAPEPSSLAAALNAPDWYAAMEDLARRTVEHRLPVEQMEQELAHAAAAVSVGIASGESAEALAAELLRSLTPMPQCADTDRTATGMGNCSVWWQGDANEPARFLCVPALPEDDAFAALIADETLHPPVAAGQG
jgi:type VI secretion system protein ImpM